MAGPRLCLLLLLAAGTPSVAAGQETDIRGVALISVIEDRHVPPIAIRPLTVVGEDAAIAREIEGIIARDLDYSDRFRVLDSLPADLAGEGVQYALWDQFELDWLVTGLVEPAGGGGGLAFAVELHDIVFGSLKAKATFRLPSPDHADFRMAVHAVSDAVVEWVTGDRGMAATRIIFRMPALAEEGVKEIYAVDSDGENLLRLTWDRSLAVSPAWSPNGRRIAYVSYKSGVPRIYELNLATGEDRPLVPDGHGHQLTPSYHPDGSTIFFAVINAEPDGLYSYNIRDGCCLKHLGGGRYNDMQPSLSPDGTAMVFLSNRLVDRNNRRTPQIYLTAVEGGDDELLSPYDFDEPGYYTDPDWSPNSNKVAFAGGIGGRRRAGRYHILVADIEVGGNRLLQLTQEGNNEDPSWAPDGRHIVFHGERSYGYGVFIVDTVTGRTRLLVRNVRVEDTDWSPPLYRH